MFRLIGPGYRGGRRAAQPPGARGYTPEGQMPELPDIEIYREALSSRIVGQELVGLRLAGPFLVRTVSPAPSEAVGHRVASVERMGKRLIICLDTDLYLALHLMVAGRLHWKKPGAPIPRGSGLAAFDFPTGTLVLTEAGTKRRASLHVVPGARLWRRSIRVGSRSSVRPAETSRPRCGARTTPSSAPSPIRASSAASATPTRTRSCTGPGCRHSSSPGPWTTRQMARLHDAAIEVLEEWTERLRGEAGGEFPEKVTAFRPEMAVHGRSAGPVRSAARRIERIVYADNECDYCPGLPDRRPYPGRSLAVSSAQGRLAAAEGRDEAASR